MFLAASVFFAAKMAVAAARQQAGVEGYFALDAPATADKLRMACAGRMVDLALLAYC